MTGKRIGSWTDIVSTFDKSGPAYRDRGPCWICEKVQVTPDGRTKQYPQCSTDMGQEKAVHRRLFEEKYGSIKHWALSRYCDSPQCVNPDHFFKGCYNGGSPRQAPARL
jgi:hypothetical protein